MRKLLLILLYYSVGIGVLSGQAPLKYQFVEPEGSGLSQTNAWFQNQRTGESKSTTLAVVLSLILPGVGEWYAGNFDTGKYLLIADGALWLTYGSYQLRGAWLHDDARSFATTNAGAQFLDKDTEYDVHVGDYSSVDDYNQAQLRDRRYDQLYTNADYASRT